VILAGKVKTGTFVSVIVTVKLPDMVLVAISVTLQLTSVTPSAKVLPDAGKQIGDNTPSTISVAVAL
jgi:hypothetical protein